jgi:hypothetical protein
LKDSDDSDRRAMHRCCPSETAVPAATETAVWPKQRLQQLKNKIIFKFHKIPNSRIKLETIS